MFFLEGVLLTFWSIMVPKTELTESNIRDLVTVITAAHTTPMNRGYLLAMASDVGALIVVVLCTLVALFHQGECSETLILMVVGKEVAGGRTYL